MSGSVTDSGHDTTSTFDTTETSGTHPSLPVAKIPIQNKLYPSENDVLPQLPSHKFRYSVWHDLRETCLTGDQLHAPRVRAGPPEKEKYFYKIVEEGLPIHHDRHGMKRHNHMNQFENWEQAKTVNLCYQELSDDFQWANFYRILEQCVAAEIINLSHNTIVTLKRINFPSCEYLNVNNNYLNSFVGFPTLPRVKSITARNNAIKEISGISTLAKTPLEELDLKGNPICFVLNYRQIIFGNLPRLRILDGIPRLPSDVLIEVPDGENKSCTIL